MEWIIGGIVILVILFITLYNGFIRLRNRVDEAFSTMDVYLKKRFNLIPNLINTVKGYTAHEKSTLEQVVNARNRALSAKDISNRAKSEGMITGALKNLFALAESYPELKADTQFLELQKQLSAMEEDIAQSRKYYNAVVKQFNTKCDLFPSSIIALIFSFKKLSYFEIDDLSQRDGIEVNFNEETA